MRLPSGLYQLVSRLTERLPCLTHAQVTGLALWVYGFALAGRCGESNVLAALAVYGHLDTIRSRLREWLANGADKRRKCCAQVDVDACFVHLMRWVLALWHADKIALAVDVTTRKDELTLIAVSVLYRNTALPVAWRVLRGNTSASYLDAIECLLERIAPALGDIRALVLCDCGLFSRRLWVCIRRLGMHPLMRMQSSILFRPRGDRQGKAAQLLATDNCIWIGEGKAFKSHPLEATLVAVWLAGYEAPCLVLTDLAADAALAFEYEMRFWIEMSFRTLKSMQADWERTKRSDLERAARHLLVLAVAAIDCAVVGTRVEDAQRVGVDPARLLAPVRTCQVIIRRSVSVLKLGLFAFSNQLRTNRLWRRQWLTPLPQPTPGPDIQVTVHAPT